jgi:hypothetical protein
VKPLEEKIERKKRKEKKRKKARYVARYVTEKYCNPHRTGTELVRDRDQI